MLMMQSPLPGSTTALKPLPMKESAFCSGSAVHPSIGVLVNAFVKMIGMFPIGCLVKLDTGEIGLVMHQTSNLMQPRILILNKFDGSEKGGQTISLLETSQGMFKRSIIGHHQCLGSENRCEKISD